MHRTLAIQVAASPCEMGFVYLVLFFRLPGTKMVCHIGQAIKFHFSENSDWSQQTVFKR